MAVQLALEYRENDVWCVTGFLHRLPFQMYANRSEMH